MEENTQTTPVPTRSQLIAALEKIAADFDKYDRRVGFILQTIVAILDKVDFPKLQHAVLSSLSMGAASTMNFAAEWELHDLENPPLNQNGENENGNK